MPSKRDVLESLTVKELMNLAKAFKIPLVKKNSQLGIKGWKQRVTEKEEIIDILLEARRLTIKRIQQYFRYYYYG
ncbi:MAG: hypothetical protein JSV20_04480 [Candidatus Bathyarchaeota archaeon]|nr:MAG: hypothetical protein JSV20_04480 [Candidatus Bathyarchaeota archaeon]